RRDYDLSVRSNLPYGSNSNSAAKCLHQCDDWLVRYGFRQCWRWPTQASKFYACVGIPRHLDGYLSDSSLFCARFKSGQHSRQPLRHAVRHSDGLPAFQQFRQHVRFWVIPALPGDLAKGGAAMSVLVFALLVVVILAVALWAVWYIPFP